MSGLFPARGEPIAWRAVEELADARARALSFAPGRGVAVVGRSSAAAVLDIVAARRARAPVTLLHPRDDAETWQQLAVLGGAARIVDEGVVIDDVVANATSDIAALPAGADVLVATSGTTGARRLAVLGADGIEASALASAANLGWRADDRWWLAMPTAHVGGLSVLTRCAASGAGVVCTPRFTPEAFAEAVDERGVTMASLVPTMLRRVLDELPGWRPPASLRAVLVGGGPTTPALALAARRRGLPVLLTWGMTEAGSQIATQPLDVARSDAPDDAANVGTPLAGFEVELRGARAWVRGGPMMLGYVGAPSPFDASGWFDTRDDVAPDTRGRLRVLGRGTELIITGGENVYPAELEAAIESHPSVAAACVVGVPDVRWGELVVAVVVGDATSEGEVAAELARRLPPHKRPKRWVWVDELQKTAADKIDRAAVRAAVCDGDRRRPLRSPS
ncbi:MAG: AMP-binding protein [Myxococcales bacterium]|nr:AMP-binding protein [Myxococcales bacterium]MCB9530310.1 AMP-binding protein [Myxococcales bacterium]